MLHEQRMMFSHQFAAALQRQFSLSKADARAIVAACPDCARFIPIEDGGVKPRGLQPRQLWQTNVTEFPQFGCLKHIHVSVDTCSAVIWTTAATSTNAKATQRHWAWAFAVLGVPEQIKTDNGPDYRSQVVARFLQRWGVKHVRGIPYNSTG